MDEDEQLRLALAISQSDFGPHHPPNNNNDPELEAAIQASIQFSRNNPPIARQTTNEDPNYQAAIQASIQENNDFNFTSRIEEEEYDAAIIRSLCSPTEPNAKIITKQLILPENISNTIKENRYNLQWELGVALKLSKTDRIITINHNDEAVVAIAESTLNNYIQNPFLLNERKHEIVHIFVDQSNIFLGSQYVPGNPEETIWNRNFDIRIIQQAIVGLVQRGRQAAEKQVFGSKPPGNHHIWQEWKKQGFSVATQDRATGKGEQMVDDAIANQMRKALIKHKNERRTIILLSGDGNSNDGRGGFADVVQDAIAMNWKFELWSWKHITSRRFIDLQRQFASNGLFQLYYFDPCRQLVTYETRRRRRNNSTRLNTKGVSNKQTDVLPDEEDLNEEDDDWFQDIISFEIIADPVRTPNGRHYERQTLLEWVRLEHNDPLTREPLQENQILPPLPEFLERLRAYRAENNIN